MKLTGLAYKQHPLPQLWDAILVGSGIGALAAAALLAKHAAKRVLVLERHYTAGGFTHVFRRPGYEWDVGVHYIGEVHRPGTEVNAVFEHLTEGRLQWNAMPDVYDRFRFGDRQFDFPTGKERFRQRLRDYFPGEAAAVDRYLDAIESATRASAGYFASKALPGPVAMLAGGLLRRGFLRYSDRTTGEVLDGLTGNPELKGLLTGQWPDYGLPPGRSSFGMHAIVASHYLEGAAYPVGGASEIAAAIAPVIQREGGRIVVDAEVTEVLLDRSGAACGVRMADGRELRAPLVISDAGARNTFGRLLPKEVAAGLGVIEEVERIPPSMAHICLYVGLKEDRPLDPANLWIYPTPDHDANFARSLDNPDAPFPAVFLSFPSAKDPSFPKRYPGRATIEVVAPVPWEWFAPWSETRWRKRGAGYEERKESLAARLLAELKRHVPEVAGRIDVAELSTPLSTRHFSNYEHGEAYGLSAVPERFRCRALGARTPVRGLYLTGQDVCSLGVTGAMFGGVVTASLILRRNLLGSVAKPTPKSGARRAA